MRTSIFIAWGLLLVGCRSNAPSGNVNVPPPNPVERVVERNVESDEMIDRIRAHRTGGLPMARGGGPPSSPLYWPSEARESLAQARCKVLSGCGESNEQCLDIESQRLANWQVDSCRGIVLDACLSEVKGTGCAELDWKLSQACAPSEVCVTPIPSE